MQRKAVVVIGMVVIASVAIGSAAFTSGTVDRAATVDVVGDDAAVTGLAPGSNGAVQYDSNSLLSIDFTQYANANGVNANASYTVGDTANANQTYAFNMTNNGDNAHDYSLGYTFDGTPPTNSNVTFEVYDDTGAKITEATDASDSATFTLTSTETAYVVITVDSSGATSNDDLSGELTITAT